MEFGVITILTFLICYLIGSFPTGYLFVKAAHHKDITKEGSGNVGTFNAITVSGSKKLGIVVLLLDFIKGALPVFLLISVFNENILTVYIASLCLIIGHNFPVWLKFKGGRGLATGAGIFLVLNYWILISWCVIWVVLMLFKRGVLMSNFYATLFLPLFAILLNALGTRITIHAVNTEGINQFVVFVIFVSLLVIFRHTEVLIKIFPFAAKNLNK